MRSAYSAGWTSTEVSMHRPPPSGLGRCACSQGLSGPPARARAHSRPPRVHRGREVFVRREEPFATPYIDVDDVGVRTCPPGTSSQMHMLTNGAYRVDCVPRGELLKGDCGPNMARSECKTSCPPGTHGFYPKCGPCAGLPGFCLPDGRGAGLSGLEAAPQDLVPGLRITIRTLRTVGNSATSVVGSFITALLDQYKLESADRPVYTLDDRPQILAVQDQGASKPGDPFWDVTVTSGPFRGMVLASTAGAQPQAPTGTLIEQWVYTVRPKAGGATLDVGQLRDALRKAPIPSSTRTVELVSVAAPPKTYATTATVVVLSTLVLLFALGGR